MWCGPLSPSVTDLQHHVTQPLWFSGSWCHDWAWLYEKRVGISIGISNALGITEEQLAMNTPARFGQALEHITNWLIWNEWSVEHLLIFQKCCCMIWGLEVRDIGVWLVQGCCESWRFQMMSTVVEDIMCGILLKSKLAQKMNILSSFLMPFLHHLMEIN